MSDKTASPEAKETVTLEFHNSKVAEATDRATAAEQRERDLQARITNLEAQVRDSSSTGAALLEMRNERDTLQAKVNRLEAGEKTLRAAQTELQTALTTANEKVHNLQQAQTSDKVRSIIEAAIDPKNGGLAPVLFEGYESDPAAWLESKFASFDAFEAHVSALLGHAPKVPGSGKGVKSGHNPSTGRLPDAGITEDQAAKLRRLGLDTKYIGVKSERELLDMKNAENAAK